MARRFIAFTTTWERDDGAVWHVMVWARNRHQAGIAGALTMALLEAREASR